MKVLLICYLDRDSSDGYHDKYIADSFQTYFSNESRDKGSYWGAKQGGGGGGRGISRWRLFRLADTFLFIVIMGLNSVKK